jgi:hypothetical protein
MTWSDSTYSAFEDLQFDCVWHVICTVPGINDYDIPGESSAFLDSGLSFQIANCFSGESLVHADNAAVVDVHHIDMLFG